ncbi:MAG: DNA repair protein RecN [Actinomycetia bacterium]|nr:DNA repair protein RecN [Actinomycetes bacterium]
MITSLSLTGLGVIESADLDLQPGLTVLTGETGAGKTMVVTSLQLLLGERASAELVRTGATRAQITAHITVDPGGEVAGRVRDAGGELEEGTLTVVRTIASGGRSRAALGGAAVPVGLLGQVGLGLVSIHGQHDQGHLAAPARQRDLLDSFGGLLPLVDEVGRGFIQLQSMRAERADLLGHHQERLREADALRFGLAEINAVRPVQGEDTALQDEELRLANAVELKQAALSVAAALSDDDSGVVAQLADLQRTLDVVRQHDARLDAVAVRLADVTYLLADLASDTTGYGNGVEADPIRLAALQDRRAQLTTVMRKYGPALTDVLAWATDAEERLASVVGTDDRIAELKGLIERATEAWNRSAEDLSEKRSAVAGRLSTAVTAELAALAMPDAELIVEVRRGREPAATGLDEVAYLLRPHRGGGLIPLQRGASGGELSRVMLALEVVLADVDPVATLVFDEVDAGVGGAAAVEVGRRLGQLGKTRQVLVVTHLPQVAAFADQHWVVRKSTEGDITSSGLGQLDDEARVKELTRMLAGLADSSSGQAHAEELLAVARAAR